MERILLLGATSAIAGEVARLHAERGDRLFLVGRSPDKLEALRVSLAPERVSGTAAVDFAQLDGLDVRPWLSALGGLDRVLIAHGELTPQEPSERSAELALRCITINFSSVVALLIQLTVEFERYGEGRIGVITSVAGERGRPRNYTYGSAKGALNLYLQGLRSRLYGTSISVTTIKLGPVDTPMTQDHQKNPLFAEKREVARRIVRAMDRGQAEVFVPWFWEPIMWAVRNMPESLFQRVGFLSGR